MTAVARLGEKFVAEFQSSRTFSVDVKLLLPF